MSSNITGYFVNGPMHGSIVEMPRRIEKYVVAKQENPKTHPRPESKPFISGSYRATHPMHIDPGTLRPTTNIAGQTYPRFWIFEWAGWDE